MVNSMLNQLERRYPHAARIQAHFDLIQRNIQTLGTQSTDSHNALEARLDIAFSNIEQQINALKANETKNDTKYREHWKRVIDDVISQRDTLKIEITQEIKALREEHTASLMRLQTQLEKWTAPDTNRNGNGIVHDESDDSDGVVARIPAARNPFASPTTTTANGGGGLEGKLKRKRAETRG